MWQDIAKSRCEIDNCRFLVHRAAEMMDVHGNKDPRTRQILSIVKAHVPVTVQVIVDRCIQVNITLDYGTLTMRTGARRDGLVARHTTLYDVRRSSHA